MLPATVQSTIVTWPLPSQIPPPEVAAELLSMVLLEIVRLPTLFTPPPLGAELPVITQSEIVKLPELKTAPPWLLFPWASVSPEMVTLSWFVMLKIPEAFRPSTVSTLAPGPVIVMSALIAGRAPWVSPIKPVRPDAKLIVSPPPGSVLAVAMAWRRLVWPDTGVAGSLSVLTVIVIDSRQRSSRSSIIGRRRAPRVRPRAR